MEKRRRNAAVQHKQIAEKFREACREANPGKKLPSYLEPSHKLLEYTIGKCLNVYFDMNRGAILKDLPFRDELLRFVYNLEIHDTTDLTKVANAVALMYKKWCLFGTPTSENKSSHSKKSKRKRK